MINKIGWFLRCWCLNRVAGVSVSSSAFLAESAKIIMSPDNFPLKNKGSVQIKAGVRICEGVLIVPYGGKVIIDENAYIGPYSVLYGHGGLTIGKNTLIATGTVIIPASHSFDDPNKLIRCQKMKMEGIRINEDVWIGAGVKILDGVEIGTGAVIGAGSVVTKSIGCYYIAVGVPAREIRKRGS